MFVKVFKPVTFWIAVTLLCPLPAFAQSLQDEFARDELYEWDRDFAEDRQFGEPGAPSDPTEGGRYSDDTAPSRPSTPRRGVTIHDRNVQLRVEREKQLLPLNVLWGTGTGLLIGGWLALIEKGDDRSTQRSIGQGLVLGAVLGAVVGLKTSLVPAAPRSAAAGLPAGRPVLSARADLHRTPPGITLPSLSYRFTLRF